MITYKEEKNNLLGDVVIIQGAVNEHEGVGAEYHYLAQKFGERNKDWRLSAQSFCEGKEENTGKLYDKMEIILLGGERKTIYFEITEFYGKF